MYETRFVAMLLFNSFLSSIVLLATCSPASDFTHIHNAHDIMSILYMIYHLPEQISLKTRSSCMHYIITFNLLQFTQFIHYPLPPLVFYRFVVLYIRGCIYMSILTASL